MLSIDELGYLPLEPQAAHLLFALVKHEAGLHRTMGHSHRRLITSRDDLTAYLDGDRIQCLVCQRRFRVLGRHLRAARGVTAADHRAT